MPASFNTPLARGTVIKTNKKYFNFTNTERRQTLILSANDDLV